MFSPSVFWKGQKGTETGCEAVSKQSVQLTEGNGAGVFPQGLRWFLIFKFYWRTITTDAGPNRVYHWSVFIQNIQQMLFKELWTHTSSLSAFLFILVMSFTFWEVVFAFLWLSVVFVALIHFLMSNKVCMRQNSERCCSAYQI